MSVNSPAPAATAAGTPEFPRHVVTAVLVAHDGARWLPKALEGLLAQDRPVQDVVAADTGSADDSARLLAESLGDQRVLHLARRTGFGAAVDEAVRSTAPLTGEDLPYLERRSGWDPVNRTWNDDVYDQPASPHGEPVQWLWLLHDDCEPDAGALAGLLRTAENSPSAAIIGPKLRSWYDRGNSSKSASPSPAAAAAGPGWNAANRTRASTTRSARCSRSPPPACSCGATCGRNSAASTAACPSCATTSTSAGAPSPPATPS